MSDDKTLAEALLRVRRAISALALPEKQAVLDSAARFLQAEVQVAQMEANAAILRAVSPAPVPAVNDEHFRA